jgi:hypothetical protein
MRWARHVVHIGNMSIVYKILVGEPEGKRPLRRPRSRWEDGIKVNFSVIDFGVWIGYIWIRIETSNSLL